MKVLVIPDVHLKPWMLKLAATILKNRPDLRAVCLGDIPDDFGKQNDLGLYEETFDAAIDLAKAFPETLWCWGNHDISYLIKGYETGYSVAAEPLVKDKLKQLSDAAGDNLKVIHRIDNVIFSHAGLCKSFADNSVHTVKASKDIDQVIDAINSMHLVDLWKDLSPLWFRPQMQTHISTYYPRKLLQVVGHTPVKTAYKKHNILSCDTCSTHSDGTPYGDSAFTLLDTETWEF